MTVQAVESDLQVLCTDLLDGRVVRLTGEIDRAQVEALRSGLLAPLPPGCRDVVVDAGEVTRVCDEAVAVLIAAPVWVESCGGRMLVSRTSPAVDEALTDLELAGALPRLAPLDTVAVEPPTLRVVPEQRPAGD
ncbi:MAG TPA: STAS domain-containing protein [Mycobacteriales bacterium]|nr:STAS domain-containing protein [Mycobacteriales bacterium]